MSRASVVKSFCLGAAVVALVWLALGCGGAGSIIPGTNPGSTLTSELGVNSLAAEVYVDPASGTVLVNGTGADATVMASEHPLQLTGALDPANPNPPVMSVVSSDHALNGVFVTVPDDPTLGTGLSYVPVWLYLLNRANPAQDINDIIVVPGNYSGVNTTRGGSNTNAVIPNVLNLQPFGLLNNDLVPQFGNQPIQGDGFTGDYAINYRRQTEPEDSYDWTFGPESGLGDPAFSPRDDPEFYYVPTQPDSNPLESTFGAGCWQLVPNPNYNRSNDEGSGGDHLAYDPRLSPYNVDDAGNTEAVARVCSGSKMTVANCISALWVGQMAASADPWGAWTTASKNPSVTSKEIELDIRDPTAAAFSFTVVVWASRWEAQILHDTTEAIGYGTGKASYNLNGVATQSVAKAVAVGEEDGIGCVVLMTTNAKDWYRQKVRNDNLQDYDLPANLNKVTLNKTKYLGLLNPATTNLTQTDFSIPVAGGPLPAPGFLGPGLPPAPGQNLPTRVTETGNIGCAVGVSNQGIRTVLRTRGTWDWYAADASVMPLGYGMISQVALNDVTAALENGYAGGAPRLDPITQQPVYTRIPSTILVAVGESPNQQTSGAIMVSTDAGDTWFQNAPNELGDRTRNQQVTNGLLSAGIFNQFDIYAVAADPRPSGVRIGEVQFNPNGLIPVVFSTDLTIIGTFGQDLGSLRQLELTAWGFLKGVNNHRVFIGGGNGNVYFSDDCLSPVYTPKVTNFTYNGDDTAQNVPGSPTPQAPKTPIPAYFGGVPANVPAGSAWQASWYSCGQPVGSEAILDLEACELFNPEKEFQTDLIVMLCTENGSFALCDDGRDNPPWVIADLTDPFDNNPPDLIRGAIRVPGGGAGPLFHTDGAMQNLVGDSPRAPGATKTDLRAITCNTWDLCPQALNDNDRWTPAASGQALQVWLVGETSNKAPLQAGLRQPIVVHNPALQSSTAVGWPVPVNGDPGSFTTVNGFLTPSGTISALVRDPLKRPAGGAEPLIPAAPGYHGWWSIQNPLANVTDPNSQATLAPDLNDVDCANPAGVKEAFMRTVVPGFPSDHSPINVPWYDASGNALVDPGEVGDVLLDPNIPNSPNAGPQPGPRYNIPAEQTGFSWVDLDGDGFVDPHGSNAQGALDHHDHPNELFATVIIPDPYAPLLWPVCWAVGGLPGVYQDNGPPGFAVPGHTSNAAGGPLLASNVLIFQPPGPGGVLPNGGGETTSIGVIKAYH